MKGEQLAKLATAAYGPQWKVSLAAAAKISREQLWRYETEVTPISDDLAVRFTKLLKAALIKQRDTILKQRKELTLMISRLD